MAAKTIEKFLGAQIAEQRRHRGLTQAELAEVADVASETISRLERGAAMPSLTRLNDIATALGTELRDLLPTAKPSAKHRALARFNSLALDLSSDEIEALTRVARALYLSPDTTRAKARKRRKGSETR